MSEELALYGDETSTPRSIAFFIPCNPPKSTAQASHRIMKRRDGTQFVGKFDSSKGKAVQDELLIMLGQHRPATAFSGPLVLIVEWCYPWRKSEPKKNMVSGWKWCDTRPDVDNLCKLLFDCMTRLGFWVDDSQISRLDFSKKWGDFPGIDIAIEEL